MSAPWRRYRLETLGCKANHYDGLELEAALKARGFVAAGHGEPVDLCVVHGCTVTAAADRSGRRLVAALRRRHPRARVVVAGCPVEAGTAAGYRAHHLLGHRGKAEAAAHLERALAGPAPAPDAPAARLDPPDAPWPEPTAPKAALAPSAGAPGAGDARVSGGTRALLRVQEGCDAHCTYCVIPAARGPGRSLRPGAAVAAVRRLVAAGAREVVLTGTRLGDYGVDLGGEPLLETLIDRILTATSLPRLRLGSLDPTEVTPGLLDRLAGDPRLCPHVHLSVQSPDPAVLKAMGRRYRDAELETCLEALAALEAPLGGVYVGVDVITGFPGETPRIFEATVARLAALPWTRLHVFPFSPRPGTAAPRLAGAVDEATRRARARRLRALSLDRVAARYQAVLDRCRCTGETVDGVLLEAADPRHPGRLGHSPGYLRCQVPDAGSLPRGAVVRVRPRAVEVDARAGDAVLVGALA